MNPDWVRRKGTAFRNAWLDLYGSPPSIHAGVLGLSVATHETMCGDAWKGPDGILGTQDDEHNWGATTLRALNGDERIVLAAKARELLGEHELASLDANSRIEFSSNPPPWRYVWIDNANGKRRELNELERAAVAPLLPSVGTGHEIRAKRAHETLLAGLPDCPAGNPADGRHGAIHCDSSPGLGAYFVWFAAFPSDVEGCAYFLRILAGRLGAPKAAKGVLERESGTEQELAQAMYGAHYFTGFHDPKKTYTATDGRSMLGAQMNIDAYASALRKLTPGIRAALQTEPLNVA